MYFLNWREEKTCN